MATVDPTNAERMPFFVGPLFGRSVRPFMTSILHQDTVIERASTCPTRAEPSHPPSGRGRVVPALFYGEEVHEVTVVGVEVLDDHRGVWDLGCSHLVVGSVRSALIWD